jgi:hypothetical protein
MDGQEVVEKAPLKDAHIVFMYAASIIWTRESGHDGTLVSNVDGEEGEGFRAGEGI